MLADTAPVIVTVESSGVPCELLTNTSASPLLNDDMKAQTPVMAATLICHAPAAVVDVTPAPATVGDPVAETQFVPSPVTAKETVPLNVPATCTTAPPSFGPIVKATELAAFDGVQTAVAAFRLLRCDGRFCAERDIAPAIRNMSANRSLFIVFIPAGASAN